MKNRPILFIVIAILHLIEPLMKVLYFKMTTPFSLSTIASNIASISGTRELFEFWFLFPLGGIALLGVKRWSYPVFVGVQIYSLWSHILYERFTWPYVSEIPFYSSLALLMMNVAIIIYFAFPDVRKPFFDRSIRWWETSPRYIQHLPITFSLTNPDILSDGEILNISRTGAFVACREVLETGTIIALNLAVADTALSLKAEIVSTHSFEGVRGIGIKFRFTNIWEDLAMRKLLRHVSKRAQVEERIARAA
jgi:hypothetical protein